VSEALQSISNSLPVGQSLETLAIHFTRVKTLFNGGIFTPSDNHKDVLLQIARGRTDLIPFIHRVFSTDKQSDLGHVRTPAP
jgi:hypothetical protein